MKNTSGADAHPAAQSDATVHIAITGIVQGVGYRESMRAVAAALAIKGWVRNRADGGVEALVQGTVEDLERMLAWCHNGPPDARVASVKSKSVQTSEPFTAFAVRPSR